MLGLSGIPLPLLIGLTAVIAYFCGCFNGAVIVSKYILRNDVRKHGSGNAGLTNFFRTFGGRAADIRGDPHRCAEGCGGHPGCQGAVYRRLYGFPLCRGCHGILADIC